MARLRDLGTLFDVLAERGSDTVVHLSRPLDIAPEDGVRYDVPCLAGLVRDAAGWLAAAEVRPGERVAIVKDNHWDYPLLAVATARMGGVPALISNHWPPATLAVLLRRLEAALLVTTRATLAALHEAGIAPATLARRVLCLDGAAPGTLCLDDVRGHEAPPPHRRDDDDPLVVMHTSGTTGVPKLVVHSTYTMIHRIVGFETRRWPFVSVRREDAVCSASAFCHGRSIAWTATAFWMTPREVLIVADTDPASAEPFLRAHPPTTLEMVPATYVRWQPLTRGPDSVFHDVRLYVSTFDAIHPPAVRAFLAASRRRWPIMAQGWGQSETGPITFRLLTRRTVAATGNRHPTTRHLGWPVPFRTRLRVLDPETLRPVPRGRTGVVTVRTEARCLGYVEEQGRWDEKVRGAWFNTGDLGIRTRTGSVLLLDREVDTIPGQSCLEIEDVVDDRLPEVIECSILGTPGRQPLPVVVTADGTLDRSAWRAAVRDLPPLDEPAVLTWEQIPRTATGKVRRMELRERLGYGTETHGSGLWT